MDKSGKRSDMDIKPTAWVAVIPDTVSQMWYKAACATPENITDKTLEIVKAVGKVVFEERTESDGGGEEK